MRPPNIVTIFILFNITIDQIFAVITEDEEFEIELKNCGCKRKLKKNISANQNSMKNILFNETTCSIDAYNRGSGQKIVGFSLYGDYTLKKL